MAIKTILFDFDGTLADTYHTFVEIVNHLSTEFGYKPVTSEDLERLKRMSSREIIKQSEISLIAIPFLLKRVKQELSQKIADLKPFNGLKGCLWQLKQEGYQLGIVTSNDKENVIAFLENNHLETLFDFIDSGVNLFGKDKIINKIIKQNHFSRHELVYVGDEIRDIQAAQASHIKMIAVGWGFNAPEALARYKPDVLITHPYQLIKALERDEQTCLQVL